MGSYLDKPQTDKTTERAQGNNLRVGLSAMQGWRTDMEDAHCVNVGIDGTPDYNFFAIFDGHGGTTVSRLASQHVLNKITQSQDWRADNRNPESIGKAMIRGFIQMDSDLRKVPEIASGDDRSGSTAISAFVTPTHIIVGNCGDSRCVLVRDNVVTEMSMDHKPYLEEERMRIEAAGGTVAMRRVNGDLAVSRALGDFSYKHSPLQPEAQQVSPVPEIRMVERSAADQYLVLACDGIWDVMSSAGVGEFILNKVLADGITDPALLAEALLDECLNQGSKDNMSAIIVAFPGAPVPDEAMVAERKKVAAEPAGAAAAAPAGAGSAEPPAQSVQAAAPTTAAPAEGVATPDPARCC